jgi:oxygen-independent coproporphyrinogen-3 oxidase
MATLGLYIHIPFCAQKCAYCDFLSMTDQADKTMDLYDKALRRHIRETALLVGKPAGKNHGWSVDTVYFGGGTPSFFTAQRLSGLLDHLKKNWTISSQAEITLEANPDSINGKFLKTVKKAGFNRISIGIQSLAPHVLSTLGRIHNASQAKQAVMDALEAGFTNVGVDLMFGVPSQTTQDLFSTLEEVVSWNIQHISLYGLKLEEGTPLFENHGELPDEDTYAKQYLASVEYLSRNHFEQYEISNFAKPSMASRHNLKYWVLHPYLGFGPSAHSDFGGKRYGNVANVEEYIEGILNGEAVIDQVEEIPDEERAGEYIMLGLRTTRGISEGEYARAFRASFDTIEKKLLAFQKLGLSRKNEEDRWQLTPKGFLVSNPILQQLLDTDPITSTLGNH